MPKKQASPTRLNLRSTRSKPLPPPSAPTDDPAEPHPVAHTTTTTTSTTASTTSTVTPSLDSPTTASASQSTTLNIKSVILGNHLLTPWFPSEYPSGLVRDPPPSSKSGKLLAGGNRQQNTGNPSKEKEEGGVVGGAGAGSIWEIPGDDAELEVKNAVNNKEVVVKGHGGGAAANGGNNGESERSRVGSAERLFVCEFCFAYSVHAEEVLGHGKFCEVKKNKGQIGKKVWEQEDGDYEIWEVYGASHKLFCQNLSLFSKLFVDNKSISFDVDSFNFYLLLSTSTSTIHGYFSKEKISWDDYNLACILVFPPYMQRGLGRLMISFSYELSRREGKVGSPEKPLSELGLKGYLSYWTSSIAEVVMGLPAMGRVDVKELSTKTGMSFEDVVTALKEMGAVVRTEGGEVYLERRKVREWVEGKKKKSGAAAGADNDEKGGSSAGGGVGKKKKRRGASAGEERDEKSGTSTGGGDKRKENKKGATAGEEKDEKSGSSAGGGVRRKSASSSGGGVGRKRVRSK